jgi:hypothetical protein
MVRWQEKEERDLVEEAVDHMTAPNDKARPRYPRKSKTTERPRAGSSQGRIGQMVIPARPMIGSIEYPNTEAVFQRSSPLGSRRLMMR